MKGNKNMMEILSRPVIKRKSNKRKKKNGLKKKRFGSPNRSVKRSSTRMSSSRTIVYPTLQQDPVGFIKRQATEAFQLLKRNPATTLSGITLIIFIVLYSIYWKSGSDLGFLEWLSNGGNLSIIKSLGSQIMGMFGSSSSGMSESTILPDELIDPGSV